MVDCVLLHIWLLMRSQHAASVSPLLLKPKGWLHASLSTLLEVHNISMPDRVSGPSRSEPSLERFVNMRALTLTRVHRGRESCLPGVPDNLRTLTLDAGRSGKKRCVANDMEYRRKHGWLEQTGCTK